jgi:hypothetical protein
VPRRRLVLGGIFAFVAAYAVFALAHMFPPAPYGIADDWRVFMGAAAVIGRGGNPYARMTLHVAEQLVDHYPHTQPALDNFTDLPVVGLLLRAFAWMPFWWSYAVFTAIGLAVSGVALRAWLSELGWVRRGAWILAALLSWPLLVGVFSGQLDLLMLGGTVAALLLMRRGSPWLAGLCMVAVLLKPHILWPLPLLLWAAWASEPALARRFAAAAVTTLAGGALLGFLLVPHAFAFFPHVLRFAGQVDQVQPDLAGMPGLLLPLPGGHLAGDLLAALGAAGVIGLTVAAIRYPRLRALPAEHRSLIPLAGLALWLALVPYAHPNDDVLLFPLVAVVIGREGGALDARWLLRGAVASVVLAGVFVVQPVAGALLLVAAMAGGTVWRDRVPARAAPALALAALTLLPAVWPFHLVPVSLTPVAAALVAVAGLLGLRATALAPQPKETATTAEPGLGTTPGARRHGSVTAVSG